MGSLIGDSNIQKDISAAGDVAAGDINKPITNHIYAPTIYHEDTILKRLLAEHEIEKEKNPAYREFSDELNKFFSKAITSKLRNLEQKLIDGDRDYLVNAAMESKERVTKKIQRYALFKSAQEIYTYLLVNIRTAFLHEVQSKIKSKAFQPHEIDEIISSKIIGPFLFNLQGSSLNIDKDELYGVMYFLTGNCYIEWD